MEERIAAFPAFIGATTMPEVCWRARAPDRDVRNIVNALYDEDYKSSKCGRRLQAERNRTAGIIEYLRNRSVVMQILHKSVYFTLRLSFQ